MLNVNLITISRQYGAGGSELAELLGRRLGWRVANSEIAMEIARRLGVPDSTMASRDEHVPTLIEQLGNSFMLGTPELTISPEFVSRPNPDEIAGATRAILKEAAAVPVVIVGHGAQAIFEGQPDTLHIRLVAPVEHRAQHICARRKCTVDEAIALAQRTDDDRARYMKQLYGKDISDPLLYDIQFMTSSVSIPETADILVTMVSPSSTAH